MAKYCGGLIFVAFQNFSKDDEEGKNFTRKYNRGWSAENLIERVQVLIKPYKASLWG